MADDAEGVAPKCNWGQGHWGTALCLGLFAFLLAPLAQACAGGHSFRDPSDPVVQGKPLSVWVKAFKDKDPQVRWDAVLAVSRLGAKAKPAIPALIELLRGDEVRSVRSATAAAFRSMRQEGRVAAPSLLGALKDDSAWQVRSAAAATLQVLKDKRAIPGLIEALHKDAHEDVRSTAASPSAISTRKLA